MVLRLGQVQPPGSEPGWSSSLPNAEAATDAVCQARDILVREAHRGQKPLVPPAHQRPDLAQQVLFSGSSTHPRKAWQSSAQAALVPVCQKRMPLRRVRSPAEPERLLPAQTELRHFPHYGPKPLLESLIAQAVLEIAIAEQMARASAEASLAEDREGVAWQAGFWPEAAGAWRAAWGQGGSPLEAGEPDRTFSRLVPWAQEPQQSKALGPNPRRHQEAMSPTAGAAQVPEKMIPKGSPQRDLRGRICPGRTGVRAAGWKVRRLWRWRGEVGPKGPKSRSRLR